MADVDVEMPLAGPDPLHPSLKDLVTADIVSDEALSAAPSPGGAADLVAPPRSSSPLSNGDSSQLSDEDEGEKDAEGEDEDAEGEDEDASGDEDNDGVQEQQAGRPAMPASAEDDDDDDNDGLGENDDENDAHGPLSPHGQSSSTSSTVPLTPEADIDVDPEADNDASVPPSPRPGIPPPEHSGSELTSDDDDEDGGDEPGDDSDKDGDGEDEEDEDEEVAEATQDIDGDVEMETPLSTPSPGSHIVALPATDEAKPVGPPNGSASKSRKPSIFASGFVPPELDTDADKDAMGVVQDEDDDESEISDIESEADKNGKPVTVVKQDEEDDDLSDVDHDEAANHEEDADRTPKARRRLSSASKGKSAVITATDVNGETEQNGDTSDAEAPSADINGSATPSKVSGGTPPPQASATTAAAPSYHLRGDPFNQSTTSVPSAPTIEALGSLVSIEIKFAQLRDRLYVERMDELAQEEVIVAKGEHPSVRYLHNILEERKNNLLRLAEIRLKKTEQQIHRARVADRKFVMSWWTDAKEKLFTEHYEQNARKKRKIEKDKLELDVGKPALPVIPKPIPAKDPIVAERIMRGYDWTRGPVIAGGLSGAEAADDLARMGLRRRQPIVYQPVSQHHYGMAAQPQMVYVDNVAGRHLQQPTHGVYHPNDDAVMMENMNGSIYDSMGRLANGHHHHHHHHPASGPASSAMGGSVPPPAVSAATSQPSHGGVPILGRPRYGHAATGVHMNPSTVPPRREGRTVPTSTLDPFDSSRRRERDRDDFVSSSKSRRNDINGGSHDVEDTTKRRRLADTGSGSTGRVHGGYGDSAYAGGSGGTRNVMDAKVNGDPAPRRSDSGGKSKPLHASGGMSTAAMFGSSLGANGPTSSFGMGAQSRSAWPFSMYSGGQTTSSTAAPTGVTTGMRMTDPIGGRNGRLVGGLGGSMRE